MFKWFNALIKCNPVTSCHLIIRISESNFNKMWLTLKELNLPLKNIKCKVCECTQVFSRGWTVFLFTQHGGPALLWSCTWLLPAFAHLLPVWGGTRCTADRREFLPYSSCSSSCYSLFLSTGVYHHWMENYLVQLSHQNQGLILASGSESKPDSDPDAKNPKPNIKLSWRSHWSC